MQSGECGVARRPAAAVIDLVSQWESSAEAAPALISWAPDLQQDGSRQQAEDRGAEASPKPS